jgi:ABC-type hemin transport system substrate-binding protein
VLGDTVVVTDTGVEVLGGMPRELFEVPALEASNAEIIQRFQHPQKKLCQQL